MQKKKEKWKNKYVMQKITPDIKMLMKSIITANTHEYAYK